MCQSHNIKTLSKGSQFLESLQRNHGRLYSYRIECKDYKPGQSKGNSVTDKG